jgi:hypothetical protein
MTENSNKYYQNFYNDGIKNAVDVYIDNGNGRYTVRRYIFENKQDAEVWRKSLGIRFETPKS